MMNNPNLSGLGLPQPLVDAIRQAFLLIQTLQNKPAPTVSPVVVTTTLSGVAGGTYTSVEQGFINNLMTAVNQLNTDVVSLQAAVNDIRLRLRLIPE